MTIETPPHCQRRARAHQRHLAHRAVAGRAADAFCDVNRMIEIGVIGQPVYFVPCDRLVVGKAPPDGLQHFRVGIELRVAGHTGVGGRNAGNGRPLDSGVTVAAVHAEAADMMFVAEGNRLRQRDVLIRNVRGPHDPVCNRDGKKRNDRDRDEHDAGDRIRGGSENLHHSPLALRSRLTLRLAVCDLIFLRAGSQSEVSIWPGEQLTPYAQRLINVPAAALFLNYAAGFGAFALP